MPKIGILHSGSQANAQGEVDAITNQLRTKCTTPVNPVVPDWSLNLQKRAESLIQQNVYVAFAAAGSRPARALISARGNANSPIIVFSSVATHLLTGINPQTTTGVCAQTSDHDDDRLGWLLEMLQNSDPNKSIGVLYNSNRDDTTNQLRAIDRAAQNKCKIVPANLDVLTMPEAFNKFRQNAVVALLVAADRFFFTNRQEVVDNANRANYPAIYQWREFVTAGGLMSFGASRGDCYDRATTMASAINDGKAVPPVHTVLVNDFELVVSQSKAAKYFPNRPLPSVIAGDHRLVLLQ